MFNEFMKDGLHLWTVRFNSRDGTGSFTDQHSVNVSAKTVEDSIKKIRDKYPNAKILSVNHKGLIDL